MFAGPLAEPETRQPGPNRTGRHEDDLMPGLVSIDHLPKEPLDRGPIERDGAFKKNAGASLDDDGAPAHTVRSVVQAPASEQGPVGRHPQPLPRCHGRGERYACVPCNLARVASC